MKRWRICLGLAALVLPVGLLIGAALASRRHHGELSRKNCLRIHVGTPEHLVLSLLGRDADVRHDHGDDCCTKEWGRGGPDGKDYLLLTLVNRAETGWEVVGGEVCWYGGEERTELMPGPGTQPLTVWEKVCLWLGLDP